MNLIHLKYAVEICLAGSINKAARNLYMEQPNLSRALKELESELGITIFNRSPKGMIPTAEGEDFLRYARKILHEVDEMNAFFRGETLPAQKFSISAPRAGYISTAFAEFSKRVKNAPEAEFIYRETNSRRAVLNIIQSGYRLAIIRYSEYHEREFKNMMDRYGLRGEKIATFHRNLLMSKNHPLASKETIVLSDLVPYVEVSHPDSYIPSVPDSALLQEEPLYPFPRRILVYERASQFELLAKNDHAFLWDSPVPNDLLAHYNLVQKPCQDASKRYADFLLCRNDYLFSPLDKEFLSLLSLQRDRYFSQL